MAPLEQMAARAKQAGFELGLVSGFRSYQAQASIWNDKFKGERPINLRDGSQFCVSGKSERDIVSAILNYSMLPGASRHHWGTDLDVYAINCQPDSQPLQLTPQEYCDSGPQAEFALWLDAHAAEFGFFRPYARDLGGVAPEPWHLSYAPLADKYLQALTAEELARVIASHPIAGQATVIAMLPEIIAQYAINICPAEDICY